STVFSIRRCNPCTWRLKSDQISLLWRCDPSDRRCNPGMFGFCEKRKMLAFWWRNPCARGENGHRLCKTQPLSFWSSTLFYLWGYCPGTTCYVVIKVKHCTITCGKCT